MRMLSAAYPTYPVGDDTLDLYLEALMPKDAGLALDAVRHWIRTQPQFPRISEVLAGIRTEERKRPEPRLELVEPPRPKMTRAQLRAMRNGESLDPGERPAQRAGTGTD